MSITVLSRNVHYTYIYGVCIQDFATPSLEGELARINLEEAEPIAGSGDTQLEQYQIARRRRWEQAYVCMKL